MKTGPLNAAGYIFAGSVLASLMTAPAFAQSVAEAVEEAAPVSGEIIVSARRVDERLQDVPISITVFTQESLTKLNITSTGDLARFTPSLSVNSRFGAEKTSFSIRGFLQDLGTAPSVGVYFAEVVAPRTGGLTSVGNGAGVGQMFDLGNVQVLKGPQGTLFGRNTTGGTILLVPQKPTRDLEGYAEVSLGNHDMRRFQGVLNLPLGETLRLRLGVDRQTRDGYLKNRSGIGPRNFADIDYTAVRASATWDVTPNLEAYFVGTYSYSDTNGHLPSMFTCNPVTGARGTGTNVNAFLGCQQVARQQARGDGYYDVENSVVNPFQKLEQWQAINHLSWTVSDNLTVKNILSYGQFREKFRTDVFGSNFLLTADAFALGFVAPGVTNAAVGRQYGVNLSSPYTNSKSGAIAAVSTLVEELQFQGTGFGDKLRWQAGFYYELSKPIGDTAGNLSGSSVYCQTDDMYACTQVPGAGSRIAGSIGATLQALRYRDYAVYGQATYEITPQLSLTGGLRYTNDKSEARTNLITYTALPVANDAARGTCGDPLLMPAGSGRTLAECVANLTHTSDAVTWLIDVDYKPSDDTLIYAKYSRGYRQGGVNLRTPGLPTFEPEKIDAYEAGFKLSFRGAVSGRLNVAAFHNLLSQQQLQLAAYLCTPAPGPTQCVGGGSSPLGRPSSGTVNAGKSRVSGVEVEGTVTLLEGLTFDAAYAYLDTRLKSIALPAAPTPIFGSFSLASGQVGGDLVLAPKHKLTLTTNYVLPLDESIGSVSLGATYSYSAANQATFADTPFIPLFGRDLGRLPATHLLNLDAKWEAIAGSPLDLSLFVTNVTKEKFPVFILANMPSFGFEGMVTNEPRMFGARLRYSFGGN